MYNRVKIPYQYQLQLFREKFGEIVSSLIGADWSLIGADCGRKDNIGHKVEEANH